MIISRDYTERERERGTEEDWEGMMRTEMIYDSPFSKFWIIIKVDDVVCPVQLRPNLSSVS